MEVMLAAKLAVYAPLYWGRIVGLGKLKDVVFTYPTKLKPSSLGEHTFPNDTMIEALLGKYRKQGYNPVLAVGDPCRTVFCSNSDFKKLSIQRTFLRRLTFNTLNKEFEGPYKRIVSHPEGMTGHMLATQYLKSQGLSKEEIPSAITTVAPGIYEQRIFDNLYHGLPEDEKRKTGYLSSNIEFQIGERSGYHRGGDFNSNAEVMTSFISLKQPYKSSSSSQSRDEEILDFFKALSSILIELRQGASSRAAFDLVHDYETAPIFLNREVGVEKSVLQLTRVLDEMVGKDGIKKSYVCDPMIAGCYRRGKKVEENVNVWSESRKNDWQNALDRLKVYREVHSKRFHADHLKNYRHIRKIKPLGLKL